MRLLARNLLQRSINISAIRSKRLLTLEEPIPLNSLRIWLQIKRKRIKTRAKSKSKRKRKERTSQRRSQHQIMCQFNGLVHCSLQQGHSFQPSRLETYRHKISKMINLACSSRSLTDLLTFKRRSSNDLARLVISKGRGKRSAYTRGSSHPPGHHSKVSDSLRNKSLSFSNLRRRFNKNSNVRKRRIQEFVWMI